MHFQWYPGHMAKAKRMMQENIKLIDVIIELVDARVPFSSKNPDIDKLANNKSRVILLNKYDLADDIQSDKWYEYFTDKGFYVTKINSKSGKGINLIKDIVMKACAEKTARDRRKGIINRPIRAMVVGIPNVGKSTFINSFVGRASTKTGNKPGVTKGKQWIRLNKYIELLDTPGILWPKFEDQDIGLKLAFIGSISDNIIQTSELALHLIVFLNKNYPKSLIKRYGIDSDIVIDDLKGAGKILEKIAYNRNFLLKGAEPDYEKAAYILLDEFRNGILGKITLELPIDITKG
ncbi:MAG TPA: ribosome biogenesis GTPase YlqF [Clostridiales bacterium]|nr:ribosome biogenesis GTPase YlqF [Clostridiales bacterium]